VSLTSAVSFFVPRAAAIFSMASSSMAAMPWRPAAGCTYSISILSAPSRERKPTGDPSSVPTSVSSPASFAPNASSSAAADDQASCCAGL
jgi:hypothetical protein